MMLFSIITRQHGVSLAIEQHAALTIREQEQRVQRAVVHAMPEHRVAQQRQVRVPGLRDRHVR
jgi:hypothetical protein